MSSGNLVPDQNKGVQTNTETEAGFPTEAEAIDFFQRVRQRLLDINSWQSFAGPATARFRLTDAQGREVDRAPRIGDHIKITIPGPGNSSGEGHDWVRIEAVETGEDELAIRVRPCPNPAGDSNDVAHFFDSDATSSFIARRRGRNVIAGIYGRNEKPNTDTDKVVDKLRNTAIATGAVTGLSKIQWKSLTNGLVSTGS